MTKAHDTWVDRIDSGVMTKSEITQFAAAVTRRAEGYEPMGRPTKLDDTEAKNLARRLKNHPVRLTDPHTEQGLAWLRQHGRKALDMPAALHAEMLDKFSHFTWDGSIVTTGWNDRGTLPVWTVHLTDGRQLRYYNGVWQSQPGYTSWWWWVPADVREVDA